MCVFVVVSIKDIATTITAAITVATLLKAFMCVSIVRTGFGIQDITTSITAIITLTT